jgi:hypothetical protein
VNVMDDKKVYWRFDETELDEIICD